MRYTNIVKAEVHQLEAGENVSETSDTFGFKYGDHNSERLAYTIFPNIILIKNKLSVEMFTIEDLITLL